MEGSQEEPAVKESDDPNDPSGDTGADDDSLSPKERLKARAEELGLDSSGTKAELEDRIAESEKK